MIGRLNHVAIAVRDIAKAAEVYRDTLGAEVSAKVPQPEHGVTHRVHHAAEHQDRTAGAARRQIRRSPNFSTRIRTAASITSATRSPTSAPRATRSRRKARACSATASRRSARMASRCCSCIRRISAARWSNSSRPNEHGISTVIAIYFLIWWIALFAVLPWGVRSQDESGEVDAGHRSRRAGRCTGSGCKLCGRRSSPPSCSEFSTAIYKQGLIPYRHAHGDFRTAAPLSAHAKKEQGAKPCSSHC